MYFNEQKSNTNIDNEFKNQQNILFKLSSLFKKYKLIIFILMALLIIGIMILFFLNKKTTQYLVLTGKDTINIQSLLNNATIIIYDIADNVQNITYNVIPKLYISNIEQDGVIITINTKKVNNEISGYYFSYDGVRLNKDTEVYLYQQLKKFLK